MPAPPSRTLSTIHKAKGLECDNAVLVAGAGRRGQGRVTVGSAAATGGVLIVD